MFDALHCQINTDRLVGCEHSRLFAKIVQELIKMMQIVIMSGNARGDGCGLFHFLERSTTQRAVLPPR